MNQKVHNQTINLIWSIADDVLRDVYTRGKYHDLILPFTVLRRLDVLLVPTKEEALKTYLVSYYCFKGFILYLGARLV